ncbi:MAG: transporter substrate-binding domain-containing protein [Blautia sp.]
MRKRKKIKCFAIALLAAGVLLTGCGTNGAMATEGKMETIEKGVLKAGMNLDNPPMGYVDEESARPAGFQAEVAEKIAEKLGLKLEIIETTEGNLLKSLDADLYDCVISMVGIDEWNSEKYAATEVYCDVSGLQDVLEEIPDSTEIAVFGKKGSKLIPVIETQALEPLKKEGTLSEISQRLLGKDIIVSE